MKQEHKNAPAAPAPTAKRDLGTESIADLIRDLATDLSDLFSKEIALAKSEVRESVSEAQAAVGAIAGGAAIAMAGLIVVLMSAVYALSNIMAPWLSALIVGAAALLIGYMMVSSAKKKMSPSAMVPERTVESAKKDKETAKRSTP